MEILKKAHPNFKGNWNDLQEFMKLTESPIRSQDREEALEAWGIYKKNRQIEALKRDNPSERMLTKGGYIASLSKKVIDLRGATLDEINLGYVDMRGVILDDASMRGVWMKGAQYQDASLIKVDFGPSDYGRNTRMMEANFNYCDLSGARLVEADLSGATFKTTNLTETDLTFTNLTNTVFTSSNLNRAILSNSRIYGIAAWDIQKEGTIQKDLLIESKNDVVSVDDLEIAQFVYLLLNNKNITNVISTIGQKAVLILGRFTPERKIVLNAIREKLRNEYNLIPIVFDFERAVEKDITETVQILAGLSRFVIADITEPKSSPLELQATIPNFMIPFVTIIQEGENPFSMFTDLWKKNNDRVLLPLEYNSLDLLLDNFQIAIMDEVLNLEEKLSEIKIIEEVKTRKLSDIVNQKNHKNE